MYVVELENIVLSGQSHEYIEFDAPSSRVHAIDIETNNII